jgi:hypothetical protein
MLILKRNILYSNRLYIITYVQPHRSDPLWSLIILLLCSVVNTKLVSDLNRVSSLGFTVKKVQAEEEWVCDLFSLFIRPEPDYEDI